MLSSITHEIPGYFNEYCLHTWNICLRKGIFEVNTLTLHTYNTFQNQHQPHCVPVYHCRILVQWFGRHSLLDIPSHTISCLKFPCCPIRFPLTFEYHVPGSTFWSAAEFLKTISHVSLIIRLLISSSITLKHYYLFLPDKVSIYVGVSRSWFWYLRT